MFIYSSLDQTATVRGSINLSINRSGALCVLVPVRAALTCSRQWAFVKKRTFEYSHRRKGQDAQLPAEENQDGSPHSQTSRR